MKRMRIIGLALVALLAVSAVTVASASAALPELLNKEGKELAKKTVTTTDTAVSTLENTAKETVTCSTSSSTGTASGTKNLVNAVVTFNGCKSSLGGACSNAGAEEIVTNKLEGQIGYIEPKTNKEVGLDLWPASRTAAEKEKHEFKAIFVKFTCGTFAGDEVRGGVIGKIANVNSLSTTNTLTYAKGANAGEQAIKKLEGVEAGFENVLEAQLFFFGFKKADEQSTQSVTYEEPAEVKA
jgi:hypothetical protein